jgi:hypothetical protein
MLNFFEVELSWFSLLSLTLIFLVCFGYHFINYYFQTTPEAKKIYLQKLPDTNVAWFFYWVFFGIIVHFVFNLFIQSKVVLMFL